MSSSRLRCSSSARFMPPGYHITAGWQGRGVSSYGLGARPSGARCGRGGWRLRVRCTWRGRRPAGAVPYTLIRRGPAGAVPYGWGAGAGGGPGSASRRGTGAGGGWRLRVRCTWRGRGPAGAVPYTLMRRAYFRPAASPCAVYMARTRARRTRALHPDVIRRGHAGAVPYGRHGRGRGETTERVPLGRVSLVYRKQSTGRHAAPCYPMNRDFDRLPSNGQPRSTC